MKVRFDPELEKRKPLLEIVQATLPVLERQVGSGADQLTASWGLDDLGKPVLTIAGWEDESSASFSPSDLVPPEKAAYSFNQMWGGILKRALRRQMKVLEAIAAAEDA